MTWRWSVHDLDERIAFARTHSPTDTFTLLARFVVRRITAVLALALIPFDVAARGIGFMMVRLLWLFMVLAVLDGIWFIVWGLLMGSSWVWLNVPWARPLVLLPGMLVAVIALVFIMLAPDPHKVPKYTSVAREWPLSWQLWRPPEAYFEGGHHLPGRSSQA